MKSEPYLRYYVLLDRHSKPFPVFAKTKYQALDKACNKYGITDRSKVRVSRTLIKTTK